MYFPFAGLRDKHRANGCPDDVPEFDFYGDLNVDREGDEDVFNLSRERDVVDPIAPTDRASSEDVSNHCQGFFSYKVFS